MSRKQIDLDHLALSAAVAIEEAAERFLAALFRAVEGRTNPFGNERICVPVEAMPTAEHKTVFRAIVAHAETNRLLNLESLRGVATAIGYSATEKTLNEFNQDLIDRLPLLESTSAGLPNYTREINVAHRRSRQVARLWKAFVSRLEDPIGRTTPRKMKGRRP